MWLVSMVYSSSLYQISLIKKSYTFSVLKWKEFSSFSKTFYSKKSCHFCGVWKSLEYNSSQRDTDTVILSDDILFHDFWQACQWNWAAVWTREMKARFFKLNSLSYRLLGRPINLIHNQFDIRKLSHVLMCFDF